MVDEDEDPVIVDGHSYFNFIALTIGHYEDVHFRIFARHYNIYFVMWFELSNEIDNMKYITKEDVPSLGKLNPKNYVVGAMDTVLDPTTGSYSLLVITHKKVNNTENMAVINQIDFPKSRMDAAFYAKWNPYR